MVNSFRWDLHCAAITQHLLYGIEKLHCHQAAVKERLKDSQGFSILLRLWPWHKLVGGGQATCIRLWHWGCEGSGWARKWNEGQVAELLRSPAKFGPRTLRRLISAEIKGLCWGFIQPGCSGVVGQSAAESAGAPPGGYETLSRRRMSLIPPRLSIKHLELHSKQLWVCDWASLCGETCRCHRSARLCHVYQHYDKSCSAQRCILREVSMHFLKKGQYKMRWRGQKRKGLIA